MGYRPQVVWPPPPQPPGRGPRRTVLLTAVAAVLVVVLAAGAVAAVVLTRGGKGGPEPTAAPPSGAPANDRVANVTDALRTVGFACFNALTYQAPAEQVVVNSCYLDPGSLDQQELTAIQSDTRWTNMAFDLFGFDPCLEAAEKYDVELKPGAGAAGGFPNVYSTEVSGITFV